MSPELLTGADITVRSLIEQGCTTVFGYPGASVVDIYDALRSRSSEIRHVLTAHEQGAAHAADGWARSTGKVGVVIATSGPGATNLVTGIATAYLDSVPLVAITGNVATSQIGTDAFQEIDITGITLPITKHNFFVSDVKETAPSIREAFRLAVSGRPGPVLVDIPRDVQIAETEYEPQPAVTAERGEGAKDVRVAQAAGLLNKCRRPLIYFGGGLAASGAQSEMLELAEKLDAPLACSLMGLSAIPSDTPGFLGMHGVYGRYAAGQAFRGADCVLALGARFNDRTLGRDGELAPEAKIIHVDIDGAELSKNVGAAVGLRGDVKKTLVKLNGLIRPRKHPAWREEVRSFADRETQLEDRRPGMTPKNILTALNARLSPETPVATDVGQHQMWAAQTLRFSLPRRFITSGGLGTMGFGLGAAVGACMATGERTVLVTSDGSLGMSLTELATAVSNRLPIVVLLLNNRALGMVRQWQTTYFGARYYATELDRKTDFVAAARAFGADGMKAGSLGELETAFDKAFGADGPFIIECPVDPNETASIGGV